MKRLAATLGALVLAGGSAGAAEPLGVPLCDDFLTKYEACIKTKVPAAQQPAAAAMVDQMRASWAGMAADATMKPQLEMSCRMSIEQVKPMLQPHGCTF